MNPKNDSLDKLVSYLCEYAASFLKLASIECRFDVPDYVPKHPLSSEMRHNLFLALKEALNNVAKHSEATEVRLGVKIKDGMLSIRIHDNGRGFEIPKSYLVGNGLQNMEKRVQRVRGQFELKSEPGKGTQILLQCPLPNERRIPLSEK